MERWIWPASQAIDKVVAQIINVRNEIQELREEMNARFAAIENRLIVVETKLGIVSIKKLKFENTSWIMHSKQPGPYWARYLLIL